MPETTATASEMWSAFKSLPSDTRARFLELMVADHAVREDLEDLLDLEIVRERSGEPTRSLDDVLAELEQ